MHYYQHHIGDFIRDAGNLPNDCLGAYMRMLWKYYVDETPLAGEVEDIAFDAATTQEIARQLLRRYFYPTPEGWRHRRCDEEIEKYREKSEKARASANARHREANAQRTQCERNANAPKNDANHKPITINQEKKDQKKGRAPLALPDWLPESVWAMWHDFRNARKGWTPKARELSLSSLTKLRDQGHEPRAVIEQSIERGWTGLFPIHGGAMPRAGPPLTKTKTEVFFEQQAEKFHDVAAQRDRDRANGVNLPQLGSYTVERPKDIPGDRENLGLGFDGRPGLGAGS